MAMPTLVVKVGGSLYDLPDLATRLRCWLDKQGVADVVLVPGGGPTTDVIRALDRRHALGEEKAHWLALRALTLNAYFLAELLPGARVVQAMVDCTPWPEEPAILDPFAFARWDEQEHPDSCLPHSWEAASDSLAARVAVTAAARRLCLLKSTGVNPHNLDWLEPKHGYVDPLFKQVLGRSRHRFLIEAHDLRNGQMKGSIQE
jgi:5-(aminomethyl)-3-furanmethanol phosphate kinase